MKLLDRMAALEQRNRELQERLFRVQQQMEDQPVPVMMAQPPQAARNLRIAPLPKLEGIAVAPHAAQKLAAGILVDGEATSPSVKPSIPLVDDVHAEEVIVKAEPPSSGAGDNWMDMLALSPSISSCGSIPPMPTRFDLGGGYAALPITG